MIIILIERRLNDCANTPADFRFAGVTFHASLYCVSKTIEH